MHRPRTRCDHARMPRYRRYHEPGHPVFVTLVTSNRRRWLAGTRDKRHLIECLHNTKRHHPFRHYAHVILDDHLHWLFQPEGGASFSDIVAAFKQCVFHGRMNLGWSARELWQKRFYDHVIRNENDFRQHMDYIHYNPVRHGYVRIARQWRWSSFHTWVARGNYPYCWGTREPDGPGEAGEPEPG
jgi:putative transposase